MSFDIPVKLCPGFTFFFIIMSSKMFPVHFFLLPTISGIAVLTPVGSAHLVSSYYRFSDLYL
jgi:hypothetical protein